MIPTGLSSTLAIKLQLWLSEINIIELLLIEFTYAHMCTN